MHIKLDDLCTEDIADFLQAHLADMRATSPPESKHALDLDALRQPDIKFWSARSENQIAGCIALKRLGHSDGEIKSMRVAPQWRGMGLSASLLAVLEQHARDAGIRALWLETGSMAFFAPARRFYLRMGFSECAPFAQYKPDPNSVFMSKLLI
ncbi:GNAT family N-acetyltransferase [Bowmanella sp. JS7-9]|uniref:GNAT family N-acetyltransferase n=1 Tax=Pseudobowmanella zhangzhouensis TaxID=1537679 RepID=A0ABW1XFS4_9ALTE|nr:GNAT family N-acetyltransferase [Bowmanella sp. JS7-9]TBX21253.1 hypothetical protein TK45_11810 [Bowmanella sp. JS7-9]